MWNRSRNQTLNIITKYYVIKYIIFSYNIICNFLTLYIFHIYCKRKATVNTKQLLLSTKQGNIIDHPAYLS